MQLLPRESLTLTVPVPLEIAIARLEANIEPYKMVRWGFSRRHAPYEGAISGATFELRRIIHYRNSFLPLIRGKFEPISDRETRIQIRMTLHPISAVVAIPLFLFWIGVVAVVLMAEILSGDFSVFSLFFGGIPILSFAMFWAVFRYEVDRSRRELTRIFSGEPPTTSGTQNLTLWLLWGLLSIVAIALIFTILTDSQTLFPAPESESQSSLCPPDGARRKL